MIAIIERIVLHVAHKPKEGRSTVRMKQIKIPPNKKTFSSANTPVQFWRDLTSLWRRLSYITIVFRIKIFPSMFFLFLIYIPSYFSCFNGGEIRAAVLTRLLKIISVKSCALLMELYPLIPGFDENLLLNRESVRSSLQFRETV